MEGGDGEGRGGGKGGGGVIGGGGERGGGLVHILVRLLRARANLKPNNNLSSAG